MNKNTPAGPLFAQELNPVDMVRMRDGTPPIGHAILLLRETDSAPRLAQWVINIGNGTGGYRIQGFIGLSTDVQPDDRWIDIEPLLKSVNGYVGGLRVH